MNIDELAQKLEKMFNSGENKNAMTQLFMIIYYDEITRLCQKEFWNVRWKRTDSKTFGEK